jgi:hypothetical protein
LAAGALGAVAGFAAAAGPAAFAALSPLIPEGLYEMRTVTDLSRVPGIAPGAQAIEAGSRQCVRNVAAGGFTAGRKAMGGSCRIEGLALQGAGASYRMACEDLESTASVSIAPGGYSMEIETTSYDGPKERRLEQYVTRQQMRARFLSAACPKG